MGHIPAGHPSLHTPEGVLTPKLPINLSEPASLGGKGRGTVWICEEEREQVFESGSRSAESREKNAKGVPCGQKHHGPKRRQGDGRGYLGSCVLDSFWCLLAATQPQQLGLGLSVHRVAAEQPWGARGAPEQAVT